ncbi:MAG: hypothetical protein ACLQDV_29495 [Candidatus Binataceae bacterium]
MDDMIREPSTLWIRFQRHLPDDTAHALAAALGVELDACKRLLGSDRTQLLNRCESAITFGSKRAAHHNTKVRVRTKYFELDQAIDELKTLAEKYLLLIYGLKHDLRQQMLLAEAGT